MTKSFICSTLQKFDLSLFDSTPKKAVKAEETLETADGATAEEMPRKDSSKLTSRKKKVLSNCYPEKLVSKICVVSRVAKKNLTFRHRYPDGGSVIMCCMI